MENTVCALKDLIENRKNLIRGFQDKSQPWNIGNESICIQLVDGLSEFLSKEVQYLEKIIQTMEKGNSTSCKHPKKDRDKCEETWYCMNCNQDL